MKFLPTTKDCKGVLHAAFRTGSRGGGGGGGSVCEIIHLKIVALLLKEKVNALLLLYHVSAQLFKDSDLIT